MLLYVEHQTQIKILNANRAKIEIIRLTQSREIGCKWSAAENETDDPI